MLMGPNANIGPGDTLVLTRDQSPYSYIYLSGLKGSKESPIVLINEGGQVILSAGIDMQSCQYLKVTGSGTKDRYGFKIRNGGVAISIHDLSAHIEAERFYVDTAKFGCWIKNEASCDSAVNNWVLDDMAIHDFEMHHIGIEGFYMGSTDPNNLSRPVNCNGVSKHNRPSRLGNIRIYNGIITNTGRPGIQLSNASVGMSEIYNNKVTNCGTEMNDQQGSGIVLGTYTRAYVHDNHVRNTLTWGIVSLGGAGLVRIENNRVDSSGYLYGKRLNWPQNICIDTRPTDPVDSTRFIIRNNHVTNPGYDVANIEVWARQKTFFSSGNIICNNTTTGGKPAKIGTDPKVKWKDCKGTTAAATAKAGTRKSLWIYVFVIGGGTLLAAGYVYALRTQRLRVARA
jgi:hypothetical protein